MTATPPLITIGITCFNAENSIERAINSALAQTWPNIQIVIVDDHSTDRSVDLITPFADKNPNVTLIRHAQNEGVGTARQTILENARGDFLAFFDDDDESDRERIATQYKRITSFESHEGSQLAACYASGHRYYDNGYRVHFSAIGSKGKAPRGSQIVDYLLFNARAPRVDYGRGVPTCSMMARTHVFRSCGGFDTELRRVEDADIAIRMGLDGASFIGCPEPLIKQYATSGSDKSARSNALAELKIIHKYKDYLLNRNRYTYARAWILFRYFHFTRRRGRMISALSRCFVAAPLYVLQHFARSAPRRFIHELRMKR